MKASIALISIILVSIWFKIFAYLVSNIIIDKNKFYKLDAEKQKYYKELKIHKMLLDEKQIKKYNIKIQNINNKLMVQNSKTLFFIVPVILFILGVLRHFFNDVIFYQWKGVIVNYWVVFIGLMLIINVIESFIRKGITNG